MAQSASFPIPAPPNTIQVLGPIAELIGAPAEDENVFGGPQFQDGAIDGRHAKNHDAQPGLLDFAPGFLV